MAASRVVSRSGLHTSHLALPPIHPLWQISITGFLLFLVRSCCLVFV